MSKFLLLLATFAAPLFAFHNLTITPNPGTIGVDTIHIRGNYEHTGDTATVVLFFMDVNNNGVFNAGVDVDILGGQSIQIIDGMPGSGDSPGDPVADGLLDIPISAQSDNGPFGSPGKFVMIMASGNIADTAEVTLVQQKTNTYIKGIIKNPAGLAANGIMVNAEIRDSTNQNSTRFSAISGSDGSYVIYLDQANRAKRLFLMVSDISGSSINPLWMYPGQIDTVITDSLLNMNMQFTAASHFLKGTVKDEHGNTVPNASLSARLQSQNDSKDFLSDNQGKFLAGLDPGDYSLDMNSQNNATYLTKYFGFAISETAETTTVIYTVLSTNAKLGGVVSDTDHVLGNNTRFEFRVTGTYNDTEYQISGSSGSAGAYSINVNSNIAHYAMQAIPHNLPDLYYAYPSLFANAVAGGTNYNVAILKGNGKISGMVYDSANRSMSFCNITMIDSAHGRSFALESENWGGYSQVVPSGTYTIVFSGYSGMSNGNFGGTVGPVVITNQDTTIDLIGKWQNIMSSKNAPLFAKVTFDFSVVNSPNMLAFKISSPIGGVAKMQLFDLKGCLAATILDRNISAGSFTLNETKQGKVFGAGKMLIARLTIHGSKNFSKIATFMIR